MWTCLQSWAGISTKYRPQTDTSQYTDTDSDTLSRLRICRTWLAFLPLHLYQPWYDIVSYAEWKYVLNYHYL